MPYLNNMGEPPHFSGVSTENIPTCYTEVRTDDTTLIYFMDVSDNTQVMAPSARHRYGYCNVCAKVWSAGAFGTVFAQPPPEMDQPLNTHASAVEWCKDHDKAFH